MLQSRSCTYQLRSHADLPPLLRGAVTGTASVDHDAWLVPCHAGVNFLGSGLRRLPDPPRCADSHNAGFQTCCPSRWELLFPRCVFLHNAEI